MNQYLVFAFDLYYPAGGFNDFQDSFPTLNEAITAAQNLLQSFDRVHIVNSADGWIDWESGKNVKNGSEK